MFKPSSQSRRLNSPISVLTNRPAFVVLVMAHRGNSVALFDFLSAIPEGFEGSILLRFDADTESSRSLQSRLKRGSSLKIKTAANTTTLGPNQLIWLNQGDTYQVSAGEQLTRVTPTKMGTETLVSSLAKHFSYRASLVLFDAIDPGECVIGIRELAVRQSPVFVWSMLQQNAAPFVTKLTQITDIQIIHSATEMAEAIARNIPRRPTVTHQITDVESTSIDKIMDILSKRLGLNLAEYKRSPLLRRLKKRMADIGIEGYEQYAELLISEADEVTHLYEDIFIGTTEFFRDSNAFNELRLTLFRYLERYTEKQLTIWSAGCSTGEETYSLAMLIDDVLQDLDSEIDFTIFATDIDIQALAIAQGAHYSENDIGTISPQFVNRYMFVDNGRYRIKNSLRSKVVFSKHDLLTQPPFNRLDLICCRNLLIYFNSDTQQRVVNRFYKHLKPGGLLMLGKAESAGRGHEFFKPVSTPAKIYRALLQSPI